MPTVLFRLAGIAALAFVAHAVSAADTPSAPPGDKLSTARGLIADKNWPAAIAELRGVNDVGSADWNNLMGYSLRKANPPDYAAAEKYYDAALRIDAKHRDALEYSGELYLLLNNLPKAEQRLAALDKACFLPCEQFTDLKKAVERYKSAAKK